ncbi:MAG TPA: MFS transporter [Stellaceae bacterium]|jgi:MFS transporter, FSR family, fosmidomycin resistance protein|nr:MFS transporter [Stellaceae bacterium]
MADMTDIAAPVTKTRDFRVISLVGAAHFMSHVYILMLPPLFIYARTEYGVSFEQLAYAMAAFGICSASLQVPAGFIVDRFGSSALLIAGLALSATGCAIVGLIPTYWALILGYALLGVANTVYHPADYAILSHGVSAPRMAQAYSIHTFLGMAGQAVAPAFMLAMAGIFDNWRSGFLAIAVITYAVAAVLLLEKDALSDRHLAKHEDGARKQASPMERESRWKILTSGPIVRSFIFFALLTMTGSAMQNFTIVGFGTLNGIPAAQASVGLTAFLIFNALGVLSGGFIADRFKHPMRIATIGLAASGVTILILAYVNFPITLFVAMLALSGFLNGVIMPSRDLIVRAVTPPGAFGVVFGFVTTGFNVSAVIAPVLYGWLMDQGEPRIIFICAAAFTALSLTMANTARAKKPAAAPKAA